MKKLILSITIGIVTLINAQASLWDGIVDIGTSIKDAAPTNYAIAPYLTYAKDAPTKVGGGVLFVYNVNNNIGVGAGLDWLGHFSQFSGNVTFKLPIHPLRIFTQTPGTFGYDFTVTPGVITGLATPLTGDNTAAVATIAGPIAFFTVAHLWGGSINIGGGYVNWTGAGAYSGWHEEAFVSYQHGF